MKPERGRNSRRKETAGGMTEKTKTERKPEKKEKYGKERRKRRKKERKLLRNSGRCV